MRSFSHSEGGTKNAVLDLLSAQEGWVSGERLSAILHVSRAAIGKHIATLRSEGHVIESVTRRGHRLLIRHEPIRPEKVIPLLGTRLLGRGEWRCLAETSSTNTLAVSWAAEGAEEGGIVIADSQTRGKGRKGGIWHSTPRSLLCSIVLRPECDPQLLDSLTGLSCKAIAATIEHCTGLPARVKEPNDVLVYGKKCCGVLVEQGLRASETDWVVVGIGCNLNAFPEELPKVEQYEITSLFAERGSAVAPDVFFASLLLHLEQGWAAAGIIEVAKA